MGTCCGKPAVESAKVSPSASLRLRSIIGRPIAPALGADLAEEDPVVPVVASIAVLIRVRPDAGAAPTLTAKDAQRLLASDDAVTKARGADVDREFLYDAVFDQNCPQRRVYQAGVASLVSQAVSGYNVVIAAYGQTGSGKTYTMAGTAAASTSSDAAGLIPRFMEDLIGRLNGGGAVAPEGSRPAAAAGPDLAAPPQGCAVQEWSMEATYVEVYMEQLRDLLDATDGGAALLGEPGPASPTAADAASGSAGGTPVPRATRVSAAPANAGFAEGRASTPQLTGSPAVDGGGAGGGKVTIRERPSGEILLEGALRLPVRGPGDVDRLMRAGNARRALAATNMNAVSSRSHAVLTLYLQLLAPSGDDGRGPARVKRSKIHLIDLAGSERAEATGATGVRLKEGAQINKSLSAFGNVINALATPGRAHIPYRDSKITRLLQDSLGGNAFTTLICCVSPNPRNWEETLSTLRFATRAKSVKSEVKANTEGPALAIQLAASQAENAALKARVLQLEALLASLGYGGSTASAPAPAVASPPRAG